MANETANLPDCTAGSLLHGHIDLRQVSVLVRLQFVVHWPEDAEELQSTWKHLVGIASMLGHFEF